MIQNFLISIIDIEYVDKVFNYIKTQKLTNQEDKGQNLISLSDVFHSLVLTGG